LRELYVAESASRTESPGGGVYGGGGVISFLVCWFRRIVATLNYTFEISSGHQVEPAGALRCGVHPVLRLSECGSVRGGGVGPLPSRERE